MKYLYTLRIHCGENEIDAISRILGIQSNSEYGWAYEVEELELDEHFDFIFEFLKILDGKEDQLKLCGILPDNIEFWMLYEYDNQCNIEFNSYQLAAIGSKGYNLCISCFKSENNVNAQS